MAEQTIEERLSTLEAEVARLKAEAKSQTQGKSATELPWWEENVGIFKNDPDYIEAMRLGREYRESLRPDDEYPETT